MKLIFTILVAGLLAASPVYAVNCGGKGEQLDHLFKGSKLSDSDAYDLERAVISDPENAFHHVELAGFFLYGKRLSNNVKEKYSKQVLWLIENCTMSYITGNLSTYLNSWQMPNAYSEAKVMWLNKLEKQSGNIQVIVNGSKFLLLEEKALARQYAEAGLKLEPTNTELQKILSRLKRQAKP